MQREKYDEPLSIDQIRQKKLALIKAINDNASIMASNLDDHNEHLIGNIPRDILETVYEQLDINLPNTYLKLRYSKPWSYLFGIDCIVDVHITFPAPQKIQAQIYEEIRSEQQLQFSKFKFKKSYSNVSSLFTDYHNYKIALIQLGFTVDLDLEGKNILIQLSA